MNIDLEQLLYHTTESGEQEKAEQAREACCICDQPILLDTELCTAETHVQV